MLVRFYANAQSIFHINLIVKQPSVFPSCHFSCEELEWASAVWDNDLQIRNSLTYFSQQIRDVFEYPAVGTDVSVQLLHLHQGKSTAAEYSVKFCTLAAQSRWNDVALKTVFLKGLNPILQAEQACKDETLRLSQYNNLAIKLDNLIRNNPV